MEDKARRGNQARIDVDECLKWLDTKPHGSVIYVCFGSIAHMSSAQLREIAMALDASDHHFIWVVRAPNNPDNEEEEEEEEWLPTGFESRNQGKGLIIRGWVGPTGVDPRPQGRGRVHDPLRVELDARGNLGRGPMVTWPLFAEQFINENLITEVLRIGVSVGADQNCDFMVAQARVRRAEIEAAVRKVMVEEEMRKRAAELKELAWKAVQEGGSSYNCLTQMLDAIRSFPTC